MSEEISLEQALTRCKILRGITLIASPLTDMMLIGRASNFDRPKPDNKDHDSKDSSEIDEAVGTLARDLGLEREKVLEELLALSEANLVYFEPEPKGYTLDEMHGVRVRATNEGSFRAMTDCESLIQTSFL